MNLASAPRRRIVLALVLLLPSALYAGVAVGWERRAVSPITGDEPHYLVIAQAIGHDHSLNVRTAYDRDHMPSAIVGPIDADGHAQTGAHGVFSIHGVGLPMIIAPVFYFFGLVGVRIWLCCVAGAIPFSLFGVARLRRIGRMESAVLAICASVSLPFLAAAGQVYPDLVSGVLILVLAFIAVAIDRAGRQSRWLWVAGFVLSVLPWLHIKNLLPAFTMVVTIGILDARNRLWSIDWRRMLRLAAPLATSVALLASYNWYAFGHVAGPYTSEAPLGATLRQAAMIFVGLHFDQLQGVFVQQPFFLVGLFGVAIFLWRSPWLASGVALTYLGVVIPNSFHPCWYGCFSMGGRFTWSVAALWFLPLVFVYAELPRLGRALVLACGAATTLWEYSLMTEWFAWGPIRLYSTMNTTIAQRNSLFSGDSRLFLPSFDNFDRYLRSVPNVAAVACAAAVLLAGALFAVSVMRRERLLVEAMRSVH